MQNIQKNGGLASLVAATTFIIGIALYATLLVEADYGNLAIEAARHIAFLTEHQALLYAWNLTIYIIFGTALVVLALALHVRLKSNAPFLSANAAVFGLVWAGLVIASGMVLNVGASAIITLNQHDPAAAANLFRTVSVIGNGLGGGNEIVGGIWILLVSRAGLVTGRLPKILGWFGLLVGGAGVATTIPPLAGLGLIFGLGSIAWFVWVGIVMLIGKAPED